MADARDIPIRATTPEMADEDPLSRPDGDTIGDIIARRYNRRDVMKGALGVTAATAVFGPAALAAAETQCAFVPKGFSFEEVEAGVDRNHRVAHGYNADVLLSWGDHLQKRKDEAPFNPVNRSVEDRKMRFGYNNDYIAFIPLDENGNFIEGAAGDKGNMRGLLCINHEYVKPEMMFPGVKPIADDDHKLADIKKWMVDIELESVGVTIVEIEKDGDKWDIRYDSPHNHRITANTKMTVDGPVVDEETGTVDKRLITKDDPSGSEIEGTAANCAGGKTPWGTYLTTEENIQYLFSTWEEENGELVHKDKGDDYPEDYKRYAIGSKKAAWGREYDRFNLAKEPNEPNRFGWIVEIDPFKHDWTPVKHTALGRFFHEGAETVLSDDNRAVVFSGDDSKNQFVFRFVSKNAYRKGPQFKEQNKTLLSKGTLYVAKFDDDGTGEWIPLEYGKGKLTKASASGLFRSQADVVIDARLAAAEAGGTRMDRPEDVQPNELTKRIYVMLTNNNTRTKNSVDAANPRPDNLFGHIIEIAPDGGDFAADTFSWDVIVRCGNPRDTQHDASWNAATTDNSWFVCPDNAAIDALGRLWIATDQGYDWQETERADGLYALETHGIRRGTPRMFFRTPIGAEMCGPCFTPNGDTLFVAVQHPGTDGVKGYCKLPKASGDDQGADGSAPYDSSKDATFNNPATRWPDFKDGMPPRPSVMVITKKGGGKIG